MGDPFTGGDHETWDQPVFTMDDYRRWKSERLEIGGRMIQSSWSFLCNACKGYPQKHTYDERCWRIDPDHRMNTSDPDCEED